MVEYVVGHTLRMHLGMDALRQDGVWEPVIPPLASERPVAMLGLGRFGRGLRAGAGGAGLSGDGLEPQPPARCWRA
jgi:glyoxylate/hydroxypyruvate reductase